MEEDLRLTERSPSSTYQTFPQTTAQGVELEPELDADSALLKKLGYSQTLQRSLSGFANFANSFSIISVITGIFQLYTFGLATGGPFSLVWGWIIVGTFTSAVALSMAEVCSAYPTSGGMYYSAAVLAPEAYAAVASWYTGWFNLLGEVANIAAINQGTASFISALIALNHGVLLTGFHRFLIATACLGVQLLINVFGNKVIELSSTISVVWHLGGLLVLAIVLAVVPPTWQSAEFVFFERINETGWESEVYVFLLGMLLAQWTLSGFDASVHMCEETKNAATAGPWAILSAVFLSFISGFVLLLILTFSIQDIDSTLSPYSGNSVTQVFFDSCGPQLGTFLIVIGLVAFFFCGVSMLTTASRTIFAFSRDGALPGSSYLHQFNTRLGIPLNGLLLAAGCGLCFSLPSIGSQTAQEAVTSIVTIGVYISYGIPIAMRFARGSSFVPGPWNLGGWSRLTNGISIVWICFISVLFVLPPRYPVTLQSFNYASFAVGITLIITTVWWFASARHWFKGPAIPDGVRNPARAKLEQ